MQEIVSQNIEKAGLSGKQDTSYAHLNGLRTLNERGTLVVGISLGNGYFNEETMNEIVAFIRRADCSALFMVTDGPSIHNFRALNYSEASAQRNARRQGIKLKGLCISCGALPSEIVEWSKVYDSPAFKESIEDLSKLFQSNKCFREDVLDAANTFLLPRSDTSITLEQCTIASNYVIEELAFLLSANEIMGIKCSSYLYHRNWPIFENLVNGVYDQITREIGIVILDHESPSNCS